MRLDSDVVLIGTGVAPLIAAQQFLRQGKSAFLLNPEYDFFNENSELPFDPLYPSTYENFSDSRLKSAQPEAMLKALQPEFPGAIQAWPGEKARDPHAPYLRTRARLWMKGNDRPSWDATEGMYLRALDASLKPQILDGLIARSRFPGVATSKTADVEHSKGVLLPRFGEVDVSRFRTGIREFVKERIGPHRMITGCQPIELIDEGIRFREEGAPRTIRVNDGVLIFWTPELTHWIETLCDRFEVQPTAPEGIRVWEEWSVVSKELLDPAVIGGFEDLIVWAETEGDPSESPLRALKILRAGPVVSTAATRGGMNASFQSQLASEDSFKSIARLCEDFLRWDDFTVRSMQYRLLFQWGNQPSGFTLRRGEYETRVLTRADGALASVVETARISSERFLQQRSTHAERSGG